MLDKYIFIGIIICFLFIFILFFLIFKAYVSRKPIFNFIDNKLLKPDMAFLGFIAQIIQCIGLCFYLIVCLLWVLFDYQWHSLLIVPTLCFLVSTIASFILLFKSYNWEISYLKYRYIGYVLIITGCTFQLLQVESQWIIERGIELPKQLNLLLNFPGSILVIIGALVSIFSTSSVKE